MLQHPLFFSVGNCLTAGNKKKSILLYTVYLYWNIWDLTMKRDLIMLIMLFNN